jgi:hypothetical protein
MDERHADSPRALNVTLAVAIARHSANGWNDAALPHDLEAFGRLLGVGPMLARERLMRSAAFAAAAEGDWYEPAVPASCERAAGSPAPAGAEAAPSHSGKLMK